ncbi:histidine phosphatase family protein [Nanchangia anserum]|uniref:Histidine phosphatase family protein n=1 Tax=Nanchangia anserum TaxID=2692125 RepID=A0A8I0GAQ3_9ACTO|nr:histidine phosphatase family protein [Nanchangia anserum]MBD3689338.1 histidine phosphatase family protein [Nanchangia anserum]QOX82646.1 histidine phosphatase family protein [Nanchangia anserum]
MTPTTTIHVMRHGEVDNPEGILYGRLPGYGLTELGHAMAAEVARTLSVQKRDITHVVASPLLRAQQTARPTAEAYGLDVAEDPRLIEAANDFEGEPVNDGWTSFLAPRLWSRYRNPLRPSWGEPYADQADRMVRAVKAAVRVAAGHEALVVSHQLPIWCLRSFVEGRPYAHLPSQRECSLASLTSLTFSGTTLVGLSYWEPAGELLSQAADMVPGTSDATLARGEAR